MKTGSSVTFRFDPIGAKRNFSLTQIVVIERCEILIRKSVSCEFELVDISEVDSCLSKILWTLLPRIINIDN